MSFPCALSVDNADYLFAQVFALFGVLLLSTVSTRSDPPVAVQPPFVFLLSCILGGKCWKNYEGGYLNSSGTLSTVWALSDSFDDA